MTKKLSEYEITSRDGPFINAECNTKIINTLVRKINELVDITNTIQKEREAERFEIQEWIDILEGVRKSVNIHEKQIDELQMKVEPEKCETPTDPYAEQRRWIGYLCWFWDDVYDLKTVGVLEELSPTEGDYMYAKRGTLTVWKHCKPVKPDDDIIYEGE